jgi:hypothetical protein
MSSIIKPTGTDLAVRCHDVAISLDGKQVAEFDNLVLIGMAVKLALQLRGIPAVEYGLLRKVALHLLKIPPTSLPAVVDLLANAEFVQVAKEGSTIKAIIPTVPYFEDLFVRAAEVAETLTLNESEQLTLALVNQLAQTPTPLSTFYGLGAEKKLVDLTTNLGKEAGYISTHRARGKDILTSPIYFAEHADSFADLAAGSGAKRVSKVLQALGQHQGWPLDVILKTGRIGEISLDQDDLAVVQTLAGEGFAVPPAINTPHAGLQHFLFAPRRASARIRPTERHLQEAAMALVAAVRQGQLLPAQYNIKYPRLLIQRLKERGYIRANTEASNQYKSLVTLRVGQLVHIGDGWYKFELLETPEAQDVVDRALKLLDNSSPKVTADEDVTMALLKGEDYIDSLIGRQHLVQQQRAKLTEESLAAINDLFLKDMR